jgi:succinate dehydrogenase / fumarate reductase membrane anchor subunit
MYAVSANGNSMRTPLARARGLGSAKDGVHHWWVQRVTAVVLAILTPWLLWQAFFEKFGFHLVCQELGNGFRSCLGPSMEGAFTKWLSEPGHALPMLAFMLALFWHAKLGLQVVIEDYVHTRWLEVALQLLNTIACAFGALVSVYAIVRVMIPYLLPH